MRSPVRLVLVSVLALICSSCGSTKECIEHGIRCENLPQHKVYAVKWVERLTDNSQRRLIATFRVRRIEVDRAGWKIDASFTNDSPSTLTFPKGGPNSPNSFGLGVFVTALPQRVEQVGNYLLAAETVQPPFPKQLGPGETWSGTMARAEPPRSSRWLRVLFGVFFWKGKPPYAGIGPYFAYQTSHSVQAPPPLGPSS